VSVIYPDDVRLTEAQHRALAADDLHAQGGELKEKAQPMVDAFVAHNEAEAAEAEAAVAAEEKAAKTTKK